MKADLDRCCVWSPFASLNKINKSFPFYLEMSYNLSDFLWPSVYFGFSTVETQIQIWHKGFWPQANGGYLVGVFNQPGHPEVLSVSNTRGTTALVYLMKGFNLKLLTFRHVWLSLEHDDLLVSSQTLNKTASLFLKSLKCAPTLPYERWSSNSPLRDSFWKHFNVTVERGNTLKPSDRYPVQQITASLLQVGRTPCVKPGQNNAN